MSNEKREAEFEAAATEAKRLSMERFGQWRLNYVVAQTERILRERETPHE